MKVIVGLSLFLFIINQSLVYSQKALNLYLPDYVLSETWFEKVGLSDYHTSYQQAMIQTRMPKRLRGSMVPFYSSDFRLQPEVLKLNVSRGLIREKMGPGSFNEYQFAYLTFRPGRYMPHALPVIYKKEELPDLSQYDSDPVLDPFAQYQNFLAHPGRGDTLQNILKKEKITPEQQRRHIYYNHPYLVRYDWYELPDPPRVFLNGDRIQSRTDRESLERLFQRGMVSQPSRLERVALKTKPWTFSGSENIQFSQAYLKNWVRGGQNSVALLSDLRLKAIYKDENTEWENTAVHKLGILSSQGAKSRVNDDLIELTSKYGVKSTEKWFYSLLFNFRTQFFDGYQGSDVDKENPISAFMAPAYFSLAGGMDFRVKNFTLLLSPLTSRMTLVIDTAKINQTRYNIEADKKSNFFTGGSFQNNFRWDIAEDIRFTSSMNVFYDYFAKEENVQAEWDVILDMRINIFLSTRIVGNFRYYESESSKLQIRQGLSLAFRYNF